MTDALLEGHEVGGYRIEDTGVRRPTGTVFRATRVATGDALALHLIAARLAAVPALRERFHRELGIVSRLATPYLLPVVETGEEVGLDDYEPVRLWAITALEPGPDLGTYVREAGGLAPGHAATLVGQAARGLARVHELGPLHRGLDPASVLVDHTAEEPAAMLTGFGLVDDGALEGGAVDIHSSPYPPSPDYVAPEQIRGGDVDGRSDIYALGGILFFGLTGRPPYRGSSIEELLNGHLRGALPVPSLASAGVPAELDRIVGRAMAKDPADRYDTASELAEDLAGFATGPEAETEATSPPPKAIDPGSDAHKERVIEAWTDAVGAGGRLWSPSAVGSGVPAASAAAPPPDEASGQGDFTQFEEARRRLADQNGDQEPPLGDDGEPPASTPMPPAGSSRRPRSAWLAAGAALLAAIAVAAVLVARGGGDESKPSTGRADTTTPRPKPRTQRIAPTRAAKPKPKPAVAGTALVAWPSRTGYTAVVYADASNRAAAAARARRAARAGVTAGVLRSNDHGSLQPGYWVAFAGVYDTAAGARRAVLRMRRAGVAANPYVRHIGPTP